MPRLSGTRARGKQRRSPHRRKHSALARPAHRAHSSHRPRVEISVSRDD